MTFYQCFGCGGDCFSDDLNVMRCNKCPNNFSRDLCDRCLFDANRENRNYKLTLLNRYSIDNTKIDQLGITNYSYHMDYSLFHIYDMLKLICQNCIPNFLKLPT